MRNIALALAVALVPACGGSESGDDVVIASHLFAPGGLAAAAGCETATVSWNAVPSAVDYTVYLAAQPGVTPASYLSLAQGRRVVGLTSPAVIGDLNPSTTYYFVVAAAAPGVEGPVSTEVSAATPTVAVPGPVGTFHTVTGTLRGLVVDGPRRRAYATNQSADRVEILDLATDTLLAPLDVGLEPWGLDLTPDGARLLVCLSGEANIAVVDLTVDPPALLAPLPVPADATGADRPRTIACAANGRAFVACAASGGPQSILRELTLATGAIVPRVDLGGGQVPDLTLMAVNPARSRVLFGKGDASKELFYYDGATDTFRGPRALEGSAISELSLNLDGTRFLANGWTLDEDLRLRRLGSTYQFHPTRPLLLAGFTLSDALTFQALDQLDAPLFGSAHLRITPDGRDAVCVASGGIVRVPLDVPRAPSLGVVASGFTVSPGRTASVAYPAFDLNGDAVETCAENLPANATYDPVTRRLSFAPDATQADQTFTVRLYASDGLRARRYDIPLRVTPVLTHPYVVLTAGGSKLLAYDHVRERAYIGTGGGVDVVDLSTGARLAPILLGMQATGMDVNPDATRLVCASNGEYVTVVDLTANPPAVAAILPVPDGPSVSHRRALEVAVAANGRAFFTTADSTTGRICELDLATFAITVRADVPAGLEPSLLRASRDRLVLVAARSGGTLAARLLSGGTFGAAATVPGFTQLDVNDDGSRVILEPFSYVRDAGFNALGQVSTGIGSRSCFRAGQLTTAIRRQFSALLQTLDLTTFSVTESFTAGGTADGALLTNAAGTRLVVYLQNGLSIVTLP